MALVPGQETWLRPAAPPQRIALIRVATGLFALVYILARAPALMSYTRFSRDIFAPVGLGSILSAPLKPFAVVAVGILAILALIPFTIGWRFRWTGPLAAFLVTWVLGYRSAWGMIFHTENMLVILLWILALFPAADALSLDARGYNQASTPEVRYGWPLRIMMMVVVTTYVLAGIAKLRHGGAAWISGDTLRVLVAHDNLRKISSGGTHSPLAGLTVAQAWLWAPLAWFSMILELGAPLALVHRRLGMLWCAAAWSFHLGVVGLMAILFPVQLLGLPYLAFFPVERVLRHPRLAALLRIRAATGVT